MEIATIGFTQSSAEHFFERLHAANIRRLLDIRLNNGSQLAGFAKSADLAYFLDKICGSKCEHDLRLAPTPDLLAEYRNKRVTWAEYESHFGKLMEEREMPSALDRASFDRAKTVLLCSEAKPDYCHRRLVAELLERSWHADVEHL
ncbi:MAG TPA: DUF488 domain-containing protein [Dehalococcoidia bacterium]